MVNCYEIHILSYNKLTTRACGDKSVSVVSLIVPVDGTNPPWVSNLCKNRATWGWICGTPFDVS